MDWLQGNPLECSRCMDGEPARATGPVRFLLRFEFEIQPLLADQAFLLCSCLNSLA